MTGNSFDISFIARAVANKLDASDTKGKDGVVESNIWDKFAGEINKSGALILAGNEDNDSGKNSLIKKGFKLETAVSMIEDFLRKNITEYMDKNMERNIEKLKCACLSFFGVDLGTIEDEENMRSFNELMDRSDKLEWTNTNPEEGYYVCFDIEGDDTIVDPWGKQIHGTASTVLRYQAAKPGVSQKECYIINQKEYYKGEPMFEKIDGIVRKKTDLSDEIKKSSN